MNAPAPAPDPRAAKAAPAPGLRFVARQPILTKDEKVFGYELLFRDGIEDYFCPNDVEAASKTMLDSSLIMGLDVLCKGGRAFVNCTRDMLLHVRNRECAAGSVPPSGAAILISPGAIALQPGQQQQFAAAVSGLSRAAVTWSATGGTITSAGLYTAPSSAGSYTVTATSAASRRRSTAAMVTCNPAVVTVTLPNPPPVTSAVQVSVSLSAASMQPGAQQQFSALVSGTSNMAVTWSAASGSIAANGLYTAPANAGTYTITAVSNGDPTKSASALAVVSAPQTVTISIAPATASVSEASHLQFTAAVSGISNNAVTWAVTRGSGTITQSGLYTAPRAAENDVITATSQADNTKSANASIAVLVPHSVALSWSASPSAVAFYKLYRGTVSGGPYAVLTSSVKATSYTDSTVQSGGIYYYVTSSVNAAGLESIYSNEIQSLIL